MHPLVVRSLIKKRTTIVSRKYKRSKSRPPDILLILRCLNSMTRQQRLVWKHPRSSTFFESDVPSFSEDIFRQNFRLSRDLFEWLLKQVGSALQKEELSMQTTICPAKRLAIGLYTLATTAEYRTIANLFGVSRSSVCVIFEEVIDVIVSRLRERYIKLPVGNQLSEVIDGFRTTWVRALKAHLTLIFTIFSRRDFHNVLVQLMGHTSQFSHRSTTHRTTTIGRLIIACMPNYLLTMRTWFEVLWSAGLEVLTMPASLDLALYIHESPEQISSQATRKWSREKTCQPFSSVTPLIRYRKIYWSLIELLIWLPINWHSTIGWAVIGWWWNVLSVAWQVRWEYLKRRVLDRCSMYRTVAQARSQEFSKGGASLVKGGAHQRKIIYHVSQMSFIRTPLQVFFGQGRCTVTLGTPRWLRAYGGGVYRNASIVRLTKSAKSFWPQLRERNEKFFSRICERYC